MFAEVLNHVCKSQIRCSKGENGFDILVQHADSIVLFLFQVIFPEQMTSNS